MQQLELTERLIYLIVSGGIGKYIDDGSWDEKDWRNAWADFTMNYGHHAFHGNTVEYILQNSKTVDDFKEYELENGIYVEVSWPFESLYYAYLRARDENYIGETPALLRIDLFKHLPVLEAVPETRSLFLDKVRIDVTWASLYSSERYRLSDPFNEKIDYSFLDKGNCGLPHKAFAACEPPKDVI